MEKVILGQTYGYKNFISEDKKNMLLDWAFENVLPDVLSSVGGRFHKKINPDDIIYDIVISIKNKIIEIENIIDWREEPIYGNFIGINKSRANIRLHTDRNEGDYIHTRWNLILSYPEEGGHSIYGGEINVLEENLMWKCVAGKVEHGSTEVSGNKHRITLSLGFLIKSS